jgi:MFS family permease
VAYNFFYGYWIVLVGFISTTLSSGLGFYGFSVLNTSVAGEFGWSRGAVTVAFSVFIISAAAGSPIAGRLTDKHGPRKVLFLGTILMSIGLLLLSRTSAIWIFYLLHIFVGIGLVLLGIVPVSKIVCNWFYRSQGTVQGLTFTGIGVGGLIIAPLIGNFFVPNFGWRCAYLAMALSLLGTMLPLTIFVLKDTPHQKGLCPYGQNEGNLPYGNSAQTEGTIDLSLEKALRTFTFWVVALTFMIYGMSMAAALQNQISILNEQGFATRAGMTALGVIGLFSGVAKLLFGYLCDHIDPKFAAAISYAAIAFSIIVMIRAQSLAHLFFYGMLFGLGQGGWAPNLAMLVVNYFGFRDYGSVLGAVQLAFYAGMAVGPVIVGLTFDLTGSYRLTLFIVALLCFFSVPAIALIRNPRLPLVENVSAY